MKKLSLAILILLLTSISMRANAEGLDKNGNGIVKGRVIFQGKDYGPLAMGDTAFRRALGDYVQSLHTQLRQGLTTELFSFGRFYCYEKRSHSDREPAFDVVQAAAGKWHQHYRPRTSDEVVLTDAAGDIADKTLCPTGYPNPVTSFSWQ
jgi:nucleoid DNA-binding protein